MDSTNESKNFLVISPNYPSTYWKFCTGLKTRGFAVFGIGDAPANELNAELQNTFTEYVQIKSLHDYESILKAAQYLTQKYGTLSGLESHNEYWLEHDAMLRRDLGINGLLPKKLESYQYKSKMKNLFISAGVGVAPFVVTRDINDVQTFINQHGFPCFAKPNKGVGARAVQKISTQTELVEFFRIPLTEDYIFEIYIEGNLYSYDGLTDKRGNIIFNAAHSFTTPIDKLKETGDECIYYTLRDIPDKLKTAGQNTVTASALLGRFFHIEFFELTKAIKNIGEIGDIVGIEVNMRPAGGFTPEMINIAKNIDLYDLWAQCMTNETVPPQNILNDTYCVNIGRHTRKSYLYNIQQIKDQYPENFVFAGTTDTHDNPFGNCEIIGKFASLTDAQNFCDYVTKTIE